jgi:hypothetical protein
VRFPGWYPQDGMVPLQRSQKFVLRRLRGALELLKVNQERPCGLEPDGISLVPASFELVSIGTNHSDTKVFTVSLVRIDTESLVGDLEANSIACKMSDDFGDVDITAPGAINCAKDAPFTIMPRILGSISRRWTIPRGRFGRITGLGNCTTPAKNDRDQEHPEKQIVSVKHESFDSKSPSNSQKTCDGRRWPGVLNQSATKAGLA